MKYEGRELSCGKMLTQPGHKVPWAGSGGINETGDRGGDRGRDIRKQTTWEGVWEQEVCSRWPQGFELECLRGR